MLDKAKSVFFVGIKGVAMANLARICHQLNKEVTGSDVDGDFITKNILASCQIRTINSFSPHLLPADTDLVIYSAAHQGRDNPQVIEALRRGIPVAHQAEIIGELLADFSTSIAVSGCHGKTTTTALLAHSLYYLKANPSFLVGAPEFSGFFGGQIDSKRYFVFEADEYGLYPPKNKTSKLRYYQPDIVICTNIAFDHPDVYDSLSQVEEEYWYWFNKIISHSPKPKSRFFFCAEDKNLLKVASRLPRESYQTFGFCKSADLHISQVSYTENKTTFSVSYRKSLINFELSVALFGEKNVLNISGVFLCLLHLGYCPKDIRAALMTFSSVKRRFELLAKIGNNFLFDDYAHHPDEIEATISAARRRFPNNRILLVFQPHTYSRTFHLQHDFIQALAEADRVYIAPIFASAREQEQKAFISSVDLASLAEKKGYQHIKGYSRIDNLLLAVAKNVQKGDIIFTMGAGDIYKLKPYFVEILEGIYA